MRASCSLEGEALFTLNTVDYPLRKDDELNFDGATYKVESAVLQVTLLPDGVVAQEIDPETGEVLSYDTEAFATAYWAPTELLVTLSVVP
jgi:hypothetical protein